MTVRRLVRAFGVDRAIAMSVTGRVWQALSTAVTVLLIAYALTASQQGYYYAVQNLVAWQIMVELGLGFVLMQLASHERAALVIDQDKHLHGDARALARLGSLLRHAVRWYGVAACALCLVLLPIGWRLLGTHHAAVTGAGSAWQWVWLGVVLSAAASLLLLPLLSVLEGLGFVAEVAQIRLAQDFASFLGLWLAFSAHLGLYALVVFHGLRAVAAGSYLLIRWRPLYRQLFSQPPSADSLHWRRDVWPLQWRVALSSLSGLFLFYVVNPLAFVHYSAADAGRLGMSQNIMNGVQSVALVWTTTKSPQFGALVARGAHAELDRIFNHARNMGSLVALIGAAVGIGACLLLQYTAVPFGARLLPASLFALLAVPVLVNQISFSQSLYLRAHKRDPFLVPSVVGAVLVMSVLTYVAQHADFPTFVQTYALLSLPGVIWSTWIFRRKRREFRAMSLVSTEPTRVSQPTIQV